MTEKVCL